MTLDYNGADTQNRTGDLILTKDALYRLSHISNFLSSIDEIRRLAMT
ncbi:argininosuccinate synthase, partial [Shewanella xiamenensis]